MWLKWLPWRFVVRYIARSHGFLDPISVMSYLRRFSQPSEVQEPIELLRAGVVLHARGLMNSRAIQHNLDWVWPYWVERQFNPADTAFVPRAFSLTHINLTHRNWTAVGIPGIDQYPIVDPAGAIMPLVDGWTLDAWVIGNDGKRIYPSRDSKPEQHLEFTTNLKLVTRHEANGLRVSSEAWMDLQGNRPTCFARFTGDSPTGGWLVVALRPCNPEGVSFLHDVALDSDDKGWLVEGKRCVEFNETVERHAASTYRDGDVANLIPDSESHKAVSCPVGLATAAAMFALQPGKTRSITVSVPLDEQHGVKGPASASAAWTEALAGHCRLRIADKHLQFLYDSALRTLLLHSPGDVYPGPYTYKRFWFRDAAFILNAMIDAGMMSRVERSLDRFFPRQTASGFFHSQEGEWDSNGEALWILNRYGETTGLPPKPEWVDAIKRGAMWIERKRLPADKGDLYGGLLPAGFSAEHLGPNDFYYWDDFWGVAGLRSAAAMMRRVNQIEDAMLYERYADDMMASIDRSLLAAEKRLGRKAMPAAPTRRLDSGAIGSITVAYPLMLWSADDPRILDSIEWLIEKCLVRGGFFQDMIHSGINAYLTLHMAQALLRAGDERAWDLARATAEIASPTGQWPEAIHPHTGGGCMGDGQHVWAAAEWVAYVRNMFVLEEPALGRLTLCAGIPEGWLGEGEPLEFGPTPTAWGAVSVRIVPGDTPEVQWTGEWRAEPPLMELRMPGRPPMMLDPGAGQARLTHEVLA